MQLITQSATAAAGDVLASTGTRPADVIVLSLATEPEPEAGRTSLCGSSRDGETGNSATGGCGACASGSDGGAACASGPRVPVLTCRDTLTAAGHAVELITAYSDKEIDVVLARLDGPPRADGLRWPAGSGTVLLVAAESDAQVRAVVRRMVRRYAPPPSRRPAEVVDGRTLPDLPPIGILPLVPSVPDGRDSDLAGRLGLPRDPAAR